MKPMTLVIVRTLKEYIYKLLCNSFKEEINENPIQKNLPSDHDGGIEVFLDEPALAPLGLVTD